HGESRFHPGSFPIGCNFKSRRSMRTVPPSRHLVGPDLEPGQCVWPEGLGDRHIGSVAPLRDQDAADPGLVVARIEGAPVPAEIGFEPAGEIAYGPRFRRADVAEI